MARNRISWVIYGVLLLTVVFVIGYLLGSNRVAAPVEVQTVLPAAEAEAPAPAVSAPEPEQAPEVVDLNTADQAALETLPGIGPELASRILAYRDTCGSFVTKEQIMDVEGIGEGRYARIEPYITVGGSQ